MVPELAARATSGAEVTPLGGNAWRLSLPAGSEGAYRWAQLDDYQSLARTQFRWLPPLRLGLSARVSAVDLPGTWGFGLWNDPFSLGTGLGGTGRRLPALPNAAWFFYASKPNYLALRDDHPAVGFLAATFASAQIPPCLSVGGLAALPALLWAPSAGLLRRALRRWVHEAAAELEISPTEWHTYTLVWERERVEFHVDGLVAWETVIAARSPLGLVLWIDNQYAAFQPTGHLRFGTLASQGPAWLELAAVDVTRG